MESRVAQLFADGAIVVAGPVRPVDEQLLPEELACIPNAVGRRRAQFGTGRLYARQALARLGLRGTPLVVGPGGAPKWPAGAAGSISHTDDYCAVVLKPSPPWRSIGLDVEDLRGLDEAVLTAITTPAERRWLALGPRGERDWRAMLLFGAKEAYYKLQHPLTGRFLDFPEVEIESDIDRGTFRVCAPSDQPPELVRLAGRFAFTDSRVLCGIEIR